MISGQVLHVLSKANVYVKGRQDLPYFFQATCAANDNKGLFIAHKPNTIFLMLDEEDRDIADYVALHELGHAMSNRAKNYPHTLRFCGKKDVAEEELAANLFAGYLLQQMGLPVPDIYHKYMGKCLDMGASLDIAKGYANNSLSKLKESLD